MDKYGVDTGSSTEDKTAQEKPKTCPICDSDLEDREETGQKKCPEHGTEPFEK